MSSRVRLDWVASAVRDTVDPSSMGDQLVDHYSIPMLEETGGPSTQPASEIESGKQLLAGGEVLISRLNPRKARVVRPNLSNDRPSLCSGEFIVLRPRGIDGRFLEYLLLAESTRQYLDGAVQSVTRSHQRVRPEVLSKMWIQLPAESEQAWIVGFLDRETARIDALIAAKRRMISALDEKWRACLNGEFETHSGLRLKRLLSAPLAYGVLVPRHDPEGVPMLRIMDLRSDVIDLTKVARIPTELSQEFRRTIVRSGDLVVSVVGTLGRSAVVTPALSGANLNRPLARVQLLAGISRQLVRWWFESEGFVQQGLLATAGDSAQPTLGLGDLKNFSVNLPLDVTEWPAIEERLRLARGRIDSMTSVLSRQIDVLVERRQALITAAVSGQLDIPGAAA